MSPLLPHREKVFALLFPHPVYMPHPISKWPARPWSHSSYPGYKSGLRTSVQHQFSLGLTCCSNSVSHSNNLYFPLILSHVWKFFSNSHPDHDNQHTNIFSISINKRSPLNLTIFFSHCPISLLLFTEKLKRIFYMCCPISLTLILSWIYSSYIFSLTISLVILSSSIPLLSIWLNPMINSSSCFTF